MKLTARGKCEKCGAIWCGTYPSTYEPKPNTTIAVRCKACNAPGQMVCACGCGLFHIEDRQIHGGSWQLRAVCTACGKSPTYPLPRRTRHVDA